MNCKLCTGKLWTTDKGICPTCFPDENRAIYGLKPLVKPTIAIENVRREATDGFIENYPAGSLADMTKS